MYALIVFIESLSIVPMPPYGAGYSSPVSYREVSAYLYTYYVHILVSREYGEQNSQKCLSSFWLTNVDSICKAAAGIAVGPMGTSDTIIISTWYRQFFTG